MLLYTGGNSIGHVVVEILAATSAPWSGGFVVVVAVESVPQCTPGVQFNSVSNSAPC